MPLTNTAYKLLSRCRELEEWLRETDPPPAWKKHDRFLFDEELEFGPRYSPTEWFGPMPNANRQRFLRGIHELDAAGLVRVSRVAGVKISHLATTESGRVVLANRPPDDASDEPVRSVDQQLDVAEMRKLVASSEDERVKVAAARVLLQATKPAARKTITPLDDLDDDDDDRDEQTDDADLANVMQQVEAEAPAVQETLDDLRDELPKPEADHAS